MSNISASDLLSNKFSLDFFNGRLTKQAESDPLTFLGPGRITQDEDGVLRLELLHSFVDQQAKGQAFDDFHKDRVFAFGQILASEHHYALEITDMSGQVWRSTNLWLGYEDGDTGWIVRAKVRRLETVRNRSTQATSISMSSSAIVPGVFEFPIQQNGWTTEGREYKGCAIPLNPGNCHLTRHENHLKVDIDIPDNEELDSFRKRVHQAVGFILGGSLSPVHEVLISKDETRYIIYSRYQYADARRLPSPVPKTWPHHAKYMEELVQCFLKSEQKPFPAFIGYWYRVQRAWGHDLENQALVLTTAIEGLVTDYFGSRLNPDPEFVSQAEVALPMINDLPIGQRAKAAVCSALRKDKKSTRTALYALVVDRILTKDLVQNWVDLRNSTVHPKDRDLTEEDQQIIVNRGHSCLEMFYRMILSYLHYKGEFICWSQPIKPEEDPPTASFGTAVSVHVEAS